MIDAELERVHAGRAHVAVVETVLGPCGHAVRGVLGCGVGGVVGARPRRAVHPVRDHAVLGVVSVRSVAALVVIAFT